MPFLLLMEAACEGSILSLLALTALCILPFLLVVWLFGQRYKQIVTGLASGVVTGSLLNDIWSEVTATPAT